jgi:LPPG:FO 2-phospho-L-lactate transferase
MIDELEIAQKQLLEWREVRRKTRLNQQLYDHLMGALLFTLHYAKENDIPLPNKDALDRMVRQAHYIIDEINATSIIEINTSDESLQRDETDGDLTEPLLGRYNKTQPDYNLVITVLAGGTGSVKLVMGLARSANDMTVISNVGDNIWIHGLYVCPDIDTIIYGLGGVIDEQRGWGIKGDTFECLAQLRKLGAPAWFSLGDRDIATHVLRTNMIRAGKSLSEVTSWIRDRYSIEAKVVPATDSEVTTWIMTGVGEMHLQEFWVRRRGAPKVTGVRYDGADQAVPNPDAIEAIQQSDLVIIAPANPVSSIGPIVAIAGLRKELVRNREKVIAVSPLIGKKALTGPAVKYMKALGIESSPLGVAQHYRDYAGTLIISKGDHSLADRIEALGLQVYETNITMRSRKDEVRLGSYILSKIRK